MSDWELANQSFRVWVNEEISGACNREWMKIYVDKIDDSVDIDDFDDMCVKVDDIWEISILDRYY